MELIAGRYYETDSGNKVYCFGEDPFDKSTYIMSSEKGNHSVCNDTLQFFDKRETVICEWKEPRKGTVWVNVYPNNTEPTIHNNRFQADQSDSYKDKKRIACIEVPWAEGDGLNKGDD